MKKLSDDEYKAAVNELYEKLNNISGNFILNNSHVDKFDVIQMLCDVIFGSQSAH